MKRKYQLKRKWNIILLHHTHLDIGYTHTQEEVLKIQFQHLEKAMELIEKNKHRPEKCRFRWNPEIMWAIDEWMAQASPSEKERFVNHVQEGYIGLDGLYGNILTGLCRPEEFMESFQIKQKLEQVTNTQIQSAMITDIPGWNWGIVTVLAEQGINYLSCGPNRGDRIGYILKDWSDKPFYWESPSTKERILVFVHGKGYSWFHSDMKATKNLSDKLNPKRISHYLRKLERQNYPYDTIIIRYNIGADNGPPDPNLSQIVESWNQEYLDMQLEISTTAKAMAEFAQKYGDTLPTFAGDITPYWEDGAASTARETAIAREAGERLTQATILSGVTKQDQYQTRLLDAWKLTFLYNEHTWGAYNSIYLPDHPFAVSQWEWKKQKAIKANSEAHQIMEEIIGSNLLYPLSYQEELNNIQNIFDGNEITVINTHNWSVSQVIMIQTRKTAIVDQQGNSVATQSLHNGKVAFIARDIPAFGKKTYHLSLGKIEESPKKGLIVGKWTLQNELVKVSIDEKYGTIESIQYKGKEFVKTSERNRFNQYVFAKGKWGQKVIYNEPENITIEIIDDGPIISTIKVTKSGYKTNIFESTISINSLSPDIFVNNILDRPLSRKKEGIHFQFPFNLDAGRVKYDTIFGSVTVDKDQLIGGNRNFISATRWVDVSNQEFGVSCALLDAPLFKSGELVHDPIRVGPPKRCGWLRKTEYNGIIYSYVMNNYWMTNYKADQPGKTLFRYVFHPHQVFEEQITARLVLEDAQPLLVMGKCQEITINKLPLETLNEAIVIMSIKYNSMVNAYFFRVYNTSNTAITCNLNLSTNSKIEVISPNKEKSLRDKSLQLGSHETIALKVTLAE